MTHRLGDDLRRNPVQQHAVGDFARELDRLRAERGEIDLHGRRRRRSGQAEILDAIEESIVTDALARQDGANDRDRLAELVERRGEP